MRGSDDEGGRGASASSRRRRGGCGWWAGRGGTLRAGPRLAAPVVVVRVRAHVQEGVVPVRGAAATQRASGRQQGRRLGAELAGRHGWVLRALPAGGRAGVAGARRDPGGDAEGVAHLPEERRDLPPRRRLAAAVGAEEHAEEHLVRRHDAGAWRRGEERGVREGGRGFGRGRGSYFLFRSGDGG